MNSERQVRVGAYAVCVRDGLILLSHQISSGPAQSQWTLPGGGVDFGENPAAAARRECEEETGLTPVIGAPLGVHSATYVVAGYALERHGMRLLFEGRFDSADRPEPVSPDDGEIDAVGWFPCEDLPQPITAWARLGAALATGRISRRTVRVLPVRSDGRVLLLKGFEPQGPLERCWFTIGGEIEVGEAPEAAAIRELAEEAGIDATPPALKGPIAGPTIEFDWDGIRIRQEQIFFTVPVDTDSVSFEAQDDLEKETIVGHGWFTPDELAATGLAAHDSLPGLLTAGLALLNDRLSR